MRTQHSVLSGAVLLCLAMTSSFAEELPVGRPYPEFQIGVTGIWAKIPDNPPGSPKDAPAVKRELVVTKTTENTPATGKFQAGDVLLSLNGESLDIRDPRPILGTAINKAEGSDGKMTFGVKQSADQRAAATINFRQARQRHAGVESAIGALQCGNGLQRCRDRSELGLERYVALAVLGRNLHTLGKLLIAQEDRDCEAARSKRKRAA